MKKTYFILFLMMNVSVLYSQVHSESVHTFENLFGPTVIINKTVTAYTYSVSKIKNDKADKGKLYSDINIPIYIIIKSDKSSASIRINSKELREDIFMEFNCIHKNTGNDFIRYDFYGSKYISASYNIPKDGSHQDLYISSLDENNNGSSYYFTISKYEEL